MGLRLTLAFITGTIVAGANAVHSNNDSRSHLQSTQDVTLASLKDLLNANACWLVLIYNTLIITYVAKRISKYVSYIL